MVNEERYKCRRGYCDDGSVRNYTRYLADSSSLQKRALLAFVDVRGVNMSPPARPKWYSSCQLRHAHQPPPPFVKHAVCSGNHIILLIRSHLMRRKAKEDGIRLLCIYCCPLVDVAPLLTRLRGNIAGPHTFFRCLFVLFLASLRDFASTLGLDDERERVFIVACPLRLADATVLREVRESRGQPCGESRCVFPSSALKPCLCVKPRILEYAAHEPAAV